MWDQLVSTAAARYTCPPRTLRSTDEPNVPECHFNRGMILQSFQYNNFGSYIKSRHFGDLGKRIESIMFRPDNTYNCVRWDCVRWRNGYCYFAASAVTLKWNTPACGMTVHSFCEVLAELLSSRCICVWSHSVLRNARAERTDAILENALFFPPDPICNSYIQNVIRIIAVIVKLNWANSFCQKFLSLMVAIKCSFFRRKL